MALDFALALQSLESELSDLKDAPLAEHTRLQLTREMRELQMHIWRARHSHPSEHQHALDLLRGAACRHLLAVSATDDSDWQVMGTRLQTENLSLEAVAAMVAQANDCPGPCVGPCPLTRAATQCIREYFVMRFALAHSDAHRMSMADYEQNMGKLFGLVWSDEACTLRSRINLCVSRVKDAAALSELHFAEKGLKLLAPLTPMSALQLRVLYQSVLSLFAEVRPTEAEAKKRQTKTPKAVKQHRRFLQKGVESVLTEES